MKPRKGLSEIVASVTVLVIVSVLGVMLYNISTGTMSEQQNNFLSEVSFEEQKAQERFEIVGVEKVTSNSIKVYLLNFSKVPTLNVTISQAYIDNKQALITTPKGSEDGNPRTMDKNKITTITVSYDDFTTNTYYNIYVVSERGVGNAYNWIYP